MACCRAEESKLEQIPSTPFLEWLSLGDWLMVSMKAGEGVDPRVGVSCGVGGLVSSSLGLIWSSREESVSCVIVSVKRKREISPRPFPSRGLGWMTDGDCFEVKRSG
jgi:hypothetical protein